MKAGIECILRKCVARNKWLVLLHMKLKGMLQQNAKSFNQNQVT